MAESDAGAGVLGGAIVGEKSTRIKLWDLNPERSDSYQDPDTGSTRSRDPYRKAVDEYPTRWNLMYGPSWDTAYLGPHRLPGLVETYVRVKRRIDKQKKNGEDGAHLIISGLEPMEFELRVYLWTQEHLDEWVRIFPLIFPAANKTKPAPALQLVLTHTAVNVIVTEVTYFQPGKVEGQRMVTIRCLQYIVPKKQPTRPKKPQTGGPPPLARNADMQGGQQPANTNKPPSPSSSNAGPNQSLPTQLQSVAP